MTRWLICAAVGIAAATVGTAAARGGQLCVGGPHCFASIQVAVDAAHDGDSIRIAPGTYAGGVVVAKSVDLVGSGAHATILSGGGHVLTIGSKTTAPTVTVTSLTLTGGHATDNPQRPTCAADLPSCGPGYADSTALGGGVEAFPGTTVTLRHVVVTGNTTSPAQQTQSVRAVCPLGPCPASFGDGAGIDNWGAMTLVDSTVSDNHASAVQSNGGGILNEAGATMTLRNSNVVGNSATAAAPMGRFVSGGGIFVAGGDALTIENSSIDGNVAALHTTIPHPFPRQSGDDAASSFGAGIQLAGGSSATISNSSLSGNAIVVDAPFGEPVGADAALCACGDVALTIENSRINGNRVTVDVLSTGDVGPMGGALEADAALTIANSRIESNTVAVDASSGDAGALGAVTLFSDRQMTISNSVISANSASAIAPGIATVVGVGLLDNGPLELDNVKVAGNLGTATGGTSFAQGGGIWNGVLFGPPESLLTLRNSQVTGNVLSGSPGILLEGAGIYTVGFPLTLDHAVVARNLPDQCKGC